MKGVVNTMSKVKCPVCGKMNNKNCPNIIPYKRKYYCENCFIEKFEPEEVDRHFFYLNFKDLIGREPLAVEWTQCNRLIKENGWNWQKLDYAMYYTYTIEKIQPLDDTGVIGILPYYEAKMMRFRNECFDVLDDIEEYGFGIEEAETVILQPKRNYNKVELKSIDSIINWEEDDE